MGRPDTLTAASMKNLFGPHFDPEKPRRTAWTDMWKKAPKAGCPSADDYDLIDYGLEDTVVLREYESI